MRRQLLTVVLFLVCVAAMAVSPRGVRTTRKGVKPDRVDYRSTVKAMEVDTLTGAAAEGRISGYEKPVRSNYETALFTNMFGKRVEQVSLRLVYKDMQGRMIHSRQKRVNVNVEPGETGQIKWRSWDVQQAYYYHRSRKPRYSAATPYDVECKIDTIFLSK